MSYSPKIDVNQKEVTLQAQPAYNQVDNILNFINLLEVNNHGALLDKEINSNQTFTLNNLLTILNHPETGKTNRVSFTIDSQLINQVESKEIIINGKQPVHYLIIHAKLGSISQDSLKNDLYMTFREGHSDGLTALTYLLDCKLTPLNINKLLELISEDNLLGVNLLGLSTQIGDISSNMYPTESPIELTMINGQYTFKTDTGQVYLNNQAIKEGLLVKKGLRKYTLVIKTAKAQLNILISV